MSRILGFLLSFIAPLFAKVDRIVILKVDGLPDELVEKYVREPGGAGKEGRSRLPWFDQVFRKNGVWMANYYSRGLSLSAPSWSILDTGRHLVIRGNSEIDRYTLRPYDYLNFFPFYVGYARNKRMDMPGVEVLDEQGVPLLIDRFPPDQRFQGFQLYQRGVSWTTLRDSLGRTFTGKPAKELFDEWQTGLALGSSIYTQTERELIANLSNPNIRYLDFFTGEYDHTAHLSNDPIPKFHTVAQIDALIGRIWTAIEKSPLAETTVLLLVSDHGMNTSEDIYSQGYNLVDWFNSSAGRRAARADQPASFDRIQAKRARSVCVRGDHAEFGVDIPGGPSFVVSHGDAGPGWQRARQHRAAEQHSQHTSGFARSDS